LSSGPGASPSPRCPVRCPSVRYAAPTSAAPPPQPQTPAPQSTPLKPPMQVQVQVQVQMQMQVLVVNVVFTSQLQILARGPGPRPGPGRAPVPLASGTNERRRSQHVGSRARTGSAASRPDAVTVVQPVSLVVSPPLLSSFLSLSLSLCLFA